MEHDLLVCPDPDGAGRAAAELVVAIARRAIRAQGKFRFAVSGGRTPWSMFANLTPAGMPWRETLLYQVDERVVPRHHPERNLFNLLQSLGGAPVEIVPMPVDAPDLEEAAERYGAGLPARFDLVHLGLGINGHTASLMPGDPVLDVSDRPVALTRASEGLRRMTLTYPGLARAEMLLWLIIGAKKRDALARLLSGRDDMPAARVVARSSLVIADRAAADPFDSNWKPCAHGVGLDRLPSRLEAPAS